MTDSYPPFQYRLEPREGYLFVEVSGKMRDREDMLRYQRDLEGALVPELGKRLMVDGRGAERPLPELRAAMWTWMSEAPCVARIAILAIEDKTTRRVKRSAEEMRIRIVPFHDEAEAEAWLLAGVAASQA